MAYIGNYMMPRLRTISILVVFITLLVMAGIFFWYKHSLEKIEHEMKGQELPVSSWSP